MKAKILFTYVDEDAVKEAENLGIHAPEPEVTPADLYLKLDRIEAAYLNDEGHIIAYLQSGHYWNISYNKELWDKIIEHLNK